MTLVGGVPLVMSLAMSVSQPSSCFACAIVRLPQRIIFDGGEDPVTIAVLAVDSWLFRDGFPVWLSKVDDVGWHDSLVARSIMLSQGFESEVKVEPLRKQLRPSENRCFIDEQPVVDDTNSSQEASQVGGIHFSNSLRGASEAF